MAKEIYKKDLYAILGVLESATDKELVRGYRKRALKCHPDKNAGNPKATELFLELSKALEILTDAAARSAYDQSRKAKKAAEERNTFLDVKRKKFKEDLEARERAFEHSPQEKTETAERDLKKEIERLMKEGSRLLQEEQERMRRELRRQHFDIDDSSARQPHEGEVPRIKLKWKAQKDDPSNGGYTTDLLNNILGCYGRISALLVSSKRNGSAIVEFENSGVVSDILNESGLKENPFSIIWLSGKPTSHEEQSQSATVNNYARPDFVSTAYTFKDSRFVDPNNGKLDGSFSGGETTESLQKCTSGNSAVLSDRNYESLVLMKMRQAEERKRLIEKMKEEDADNG